MDAELVEPDAQASVEKDELMGLGKVVPKESG